MNQEGALIRGVRQRKLDHLRICLDKEVDYTISNGFEEYRFVHNALPELNKDDIDLSMRFLRKKISCPLMIAPISGGVSLAKKINHNLAAAAQELSIPMGVGSQRVMVEHPGTASTFKVRDVAPDILLLANLGAVQLNNGFGIKECRHVVETIEADALVFHLNPLQEAIQLEGNTNYNGLAEKIGEITEALDVPVIIKEVGCGISYEVAKRLYAMGVGIIDVAGSGGTSWAMVESYRNSIGGAFKDWGISTAEAVRTASYVKDMGIIASGGIRSGIDIAKAIALGADIASVARPLLRPALLGSNSVAGEIGRYIEELRIAMFCIGASSVEDLRNNSALVRIS